MEQQALFYQDSHLRQFTARVLSCTADGDGFLVTLDQTAFYPEGGGQPCDTGLLGGVAVTDVRRRDGQIVHRCAGPLTVGDTVEGAIDWERRLDLMQQHSGEHIVSGLIHATYGYDNVGFHIGHDVITIDFNGELTMEQLSDIERRANEAVWANTPVPIFYPDAETLASLPYRSKKELTGDVRLVEFPGCDLCACCGTHVKATGEIGLIRLLSVVRFKGGVRIEMACGGRALDHTRAVWEQNRRISNLLSAKPLETAAAAERMAHQLEQVKYRVVELENQHFTAVAQSVAGTGNVLHFEDGLSPDGVRRLAIAMGEVCGGRAAVFSAQESGGYAYALCETDGDLRQLSRAMNDALQGRGGGKPNFVQGSVRADRAVIEAFFASL